MITGYLVPDEGEILVEGEPVREEDSNLRKKIGYLPENNPLYGDMYVREYLRYVGRIYQVPNVQKRIADVIAQTGLLSESHKPIKMLSKGYRQRIGLAQAILHDPEVLILDEATSGLDPNQLIEIRQLIRELGKTKTILLSTHIMQEVQALCDRVVIINKGKIVADGNIPMLSQMLSKQYRVRVTFSGTIPDNSLKEIQGYLSHEKKTGNTYIIGGQSSALNEGVFDLAVKKNWKILEMSSMEESVEHIFQQLTQQT